MRTLFMGSPEFAVPFLKLLHEKTQLLGVWTQPAKPAGRGMELTPSAVSIAAQKLNIPVFEPVSLKQDKDVWLTQIKELDLDLILVVAYGKILQKDFLWIPRNGCINVHASLLPNYRGAAPIQWALINGDKETGITLMQMDAGMDTGDIITQEKLPIELSDNTASLKSKLCTLGVSMVSSLLDTFMVGKVPARTPQNHAHWTPARPLNKEDGQIFFAQDVRSVIGRIQGVTPWPGAYIYYKNISSEKNTSHPAQILKLYEPSLSCFAIGGEPPGRIVAINQDGIHIACRNGVICIKELQLPGKKRLPAHIFQMGQALKQGDCLE